MPRLTFTSLAVALLGAALLSPAAASADAGSQVSVLAPKWRAQPAGPLQISVRPSGTVRDLRVHFDGKAVRTRTTKGGSRIAELPSSRFRPGEHYLKTSWRDAKGKAHTRAHRFTSLRRESGAVRISTRPEPARGVLKLGVMSAAGVQHIRVSINGRQTVVTPPTRKGGKLALAFGANDGVRVGRNQITVTATRPSKRTATVVRTEVRVDGSRPLLRRVKPYQAVNGTPARLDGRVVFSGKQVGYRWTVVGQPKGSRPVLKGANTARPTILAKVPGNYRVRLQVSTGGAGTATASTLQAYDADVDVTAPIPVTGAWLSTNPANQDAAVQFGGQTYKTYGACPRVLWLDANTLAPILPWDFAGYLEGPDTPEGCVHGSTVTDYVKDQYEARQLATPGPEIAILVNKGGLSDLSYLADGGASPSTYVFTVDPDAADAGLSAGVSHATSGSASGQALAGAPGGVAGWVQRSYQVSDSSGTGSVPVVTGVGPFRLVPGAQVTYQTHGPAGTGANTMTFSAISGDGASTTSVPVTATIPGGVADGFHLVTIDDLGRVQFNQAYAATDTGSLAAQINQLIDAKTNSTLFLQSIGHPQRDGSSWDSLAAAVARLNSANNHGGPDALLRSGSSPAPAGTPANPNPGTYALAAYIGPTMQPDPLGNTPTTAEASSVDGTGELSGLLVAQSAGGGLTPVLSRPGATGAVAALKGIVESPAVAHVENPAEDAVMTYLNTVPELSDATENTCYPGVNYSDLPPYLYLRASYCNATMSDAQWTRMESVLDSLSKLNTPPSGYNSAQDPDGTVFKNVTAQLTTEFDAVANVRDAFKIGGTLDGWIGDTNTQVQKNGLQGLNVPATTPSAVGTAFNPWRLLEPALRLATVVPGGGEVLGTVLDAVDLGHTFLDDGSAPGSVPDSAGANETVQPQNLVNQATSQLTNAQLALGPVLDRILTDPAKLARVNDNLLGKSTPTNTGIDLFTANWSTSDVGISAAEVAAAQGMRQELAKNWMSAYYQVWQAPTADRHGGGDPNAPKPRNASDLVGLNCNDMIGKVNPEREEWHVFSTNPTQNYSWPSTAAFILQDRGTPSAISALVQRQPGDNPWTDGLDKNGNVSGTRHIVPPSADLINTLTKPTSQGGVYGLSTSALFRGMQSVNGLPSMASGDFYVSKDCGW